MHFPAVFLRRCSFCGLIKPSGSLIWNRLSCIFSTEKKHPSLKTFCIHHDDICLRYRFSFLPTRRSNRLKHINRCLCCLLSSQSTQIPSQTYSKLFPTRDMNFADCNAMIKEQDNWHILCSLQRELKKQFLLVEKEQQEKIKLKREIEDSIRAYHSLSIELKDSKAELLKDQGFGNCYNFIKDVIIGISTSIHIGKKIIYLAEDRSSLINLVVQHFYENIETNDLYCKDITKLAHLLMSELFLNQETVPKAHKNRIIEAWKYYMEKVDQQHYFEQISNTTLKQLLKEDKKVNRSSVKSDKDIDDGDGPVEYSWEAKNKDQLIEEFIEKIEKESQISPPSIKIPLRAAFEGQAPDDENRIIRTWQLVSSFYLTPFKTVSANPALPTHLKERILNFVDDLINKCKFVSQLSHDCLGENKIRSSVAFPSIQRICRNLIDLNEARYRQVFLEADQAVNPLSIQIKIVGTSLNLIQLHELLILLNTHKEAFAKINQRVIHRTQRIFEMSPNLQILKRDKPSLLYVSLAELRYEESISSDYYKNYSNIYRTETLKQILKQVLVELQSLGDYRTSTRIIFSEIFSNIVQRNMQTRSKSSLSAQLEMKVKYLIYLLQSKDKEELQIIQEMDHELKERNSTNIKLFEDTKFSLLKVYCNLRNLKLQLRGRQEGQRRSKCKLLLLDKIQDYRLNYCVSSRASRNRAMGEEAVDQYRYRMSSADQILISPVQSCIHKDNIFTGTQYHAQTISKFLKIFTSLPEVRYFLGNPAFISNQKQPSHYTYCNQNKIRQAFAQFLREVIEKLKVEQEEKGMVESILYRKLSQLLLGKDNPYTFPKDRQLTDKIDMIQLQKQGREVESPRKQDNTKKRRGSATIDDTPFKNIGLSIKGNHDPIQIDQLIQIGARHITALGQATSPQDKIRKLKELIELYRAVLDKNDPKTGEIIQKLLANSVISARLPNLISTLSYLQIFLGEDKLISSEGMVLKQLQKAVMRVFEGVHSDRQHIDRSRILEC